MSRETTLANFQAREAAANWRAHKRFCARCQRASRCRAWDDLCSVGRQAREDHRLASAELARNRALDKQPSPNQAPLFGEADMPS